MQRAEVSKASSLLSLTPKNYVALMSFDLGDQYQNALAMGFSNLSFLRNLSSCPPVLIPFEPKMG